MTLGRKLGNLAGVLAGVVSALAIGAALAGEAPMLAAKVAAETLPAVAERLPANPLVVTPNERVGEYGGTWRSALVGGADDPWIMRTLSYENLMRWSPDWKEIVPNVAESVEVSPDATQYTFKLRAGMKWSDGAPFTSEDVRFWFEDLYLDKQFTPAPAEPFISSDGKPATLEIIDETTFKFTFGQPKGLFLQYLATARPLDIASVRYPKHYLEKFHPKYNPKVADEIAAAGQSDWVGLMVSKANFWLNTDVPTINPWVFTQGYGSGSATRALAERNPYYWKVDTAGNQLPYIDVRDFDVLSDAQVLVTKTLAGEIDLQDRNLATTANKPVLFEGREAGGYEFFEETPVSPNYMVLMLNLNHKDPATRALYQNKDFRIGLSYALDRQEVLDVVWLGQGEVAQTSPLPISVYYNEQLARQYTELDLANPQHPNYPEWLRFSSGVIRGLAASISDHIFAKRPDAALALSRGAPMLYHEANNAFGRELWPHQTSESVSAHLTGLPEVPVLVNSVSFVDMPYRMSGEQPELFAQYLIQAIARGGNPSTYIMGAPGRIPYANLPLAGEVTRFHKANRELYAQLKPGATVGVVRPDTLRSASPGYEETVKEFRGIYSMLKERHIPFDALAADLLKKMADEGNLARYATLILPDLGSLGPDAAAALDAYVAAGGNLVLTATSGITTEGGIELASGPAVMRVGEPLSGPALWSSFVTDAEQPAIGDYRYAKTVIPVYGSYAHFVWRTKIDKRGSYLPQAPFGPPEKCYGHTGSEQPGVVERVVGKGRVMLFPWSVGRTYHEFGTTEVRDYFLRETASLLQSTVSADLPEQVELIVSRDDDGLVLHVINQTGSRRKSFGPHVPISGGSLRIRGGKSARTLVSKDQPTIRQDGDDLVIDLPTLELFEVLRVPLAG